jgi:hypothetical protein
MRVLGRGLLPLLAAVGTGIAVLAPDLELIFVGAYIGGPIADNEGYVLLMSIYGLIMLLSVVALRGVTERTARA